MLNGAMQNLGDLMQRGGYVMWPLAALSLLGFTLMFERCWFWATTHSPWRTAKLRRVGRYLREGHHDKAMALVEDDRSIYGRLVRQLIQEGDDDAVAADAIECQRPRLDRFMSTLGTIITAAPMLGILGTVTGIIDAFRVLSAEAVTDPGAVGAGIAEALLTTVAGLIIALVVLFPYNAFRAQIDRAYGQMQTLVTAAQASRRAKREAEPASR